MCEYLLSSCRSISSVLVRFAKRVFIFSRYDDYVIVVGLDVDVPTPLPDLIGEFIKNAAGRAPDLPLPVQQVQVSATGE